MGANCRIRHPGINLDLLLQPFRLGKECNEGDSPRSFLHAVPLLADGIHKLFSAGHQRVGIFVVADSRVGYGSGDRGGAGGDFEGET